MDEHDATLTHQSTPSVPVGDVFGEPRVGELLGGRFLLREVLGRGGAGTVFAAIDSKVGQKVAIKVLHTNLRDFKTLERLRREVRASRVGHPNVVTVFDLHESGGHVFLCMELIEGESLREKLERESTLALSETIFIGREISRALEHLHRQGLVHRDVKPNNVLLGISGETKLCDMGLARPLEEGCTVTESEMVVGTPDYMAPEQATGSELTAASDVYALGLTLFRCMTGEVPLREASAIATLSRRQKGRPPSVKKLRPDCPPWLERLLRNMLEPLPADRPNATTVRRALARQQMRPRLRRRTFVSGLAGVTAAVALFAGVQSLVHRPTILVEVGRSEIAGRDGKGHSTWHRDFDIPVLSQQRADLDGDGLDEILLVLSEPDDTGSRSSTVAGPEIWIMGNDGRVLSHFRPEDNIRWSFDYDVEIKASLHLLDLDHDGKPEVVVVGKHHNFFPAVIFLYRPEGDRWDQVMTHPGHILNIRATPTQARPGLRFVAVNNRLGVLGFLGEIHILHDDGSSRLNIRSKTVAQGLQSPPFGSAPTSPPYRWSAYVPLPLNAASFLSERTVISDLPGGRTQLLSSRGEVLIYDEKWNQIPGPNAGKDLRLLRMAFMDELFFFSPYVQRMTPYGMISQRSEMLVRFEPLLSEPVYRLILDLNSSRALARAGRLEKAREILSQCVLQSNHADAIYRLSHLDALSGDLIGASDRLDKMITTPDREGFATRVFFDGPHLALRLAIENRDVFTVNLAISRLSGEGMTPGKIRVAESLRARSRLWWDELQPEDLEVGSWAYAPSGEAIACLARWRKGVSRPDDAGSMNAFVTRNPDAAFEGRLARGAAFLGTNRISEALDELNVLVQQLAFPAKDDFAIHQLLELAQALKIVALQADGQIERARTEALELQTSLTPGLLPAILVNEVLAR